MSSDSSSGSSSGEENEEWIEKKSNENLLYKMYLVINVG